MYLEWKLNHYNQRCTEISGYGCSVVDNMLFPQNCVVVVVVCYHACVSMCAWCVIGCVCAGIICWKMLTSHQRLYQNVMLIVFYNKFINVYSLVYLARVI